MGKTMALDVRRGWVVGLLAVGLGLGPTACVATQSGPPPRGVVVTGPPPTPIVEERPAPRTPTAVWVPGYWHWTGLQYAWIPGHWENPPPGTTWNAPRYSQQGGSHFYEPGNWNRLSPEPRRANAFR